MATTITRKDLARVPVTFTADPHGYRRDSDGKALQGITGMIEDLLYPNEYAAVSPAVLEAKARWGTARHREIQDMVVWGDEPHTEAQQAFTSLMQGAGLRPVASEYTVSDLEDFASNIDVVCDDCSLVDIKTVASLNRRKVAWQLSIYAYLFELCNPSLQAGRLFAAWIPKTGSPRLVELQRIPAEDVQRLMQCRLQGQPYAKPEPSAQLVEQIAEVKLQMESLKEQYDRLTAELMADMQARGIQSYTDEYVTVSLRAGGETTRFDAKSFQQADPATYSRFLRTSATAPSLTVRLKDPAGQRKATKEAPCASASPTPARSSDTSTTPLPSMPAASSPGTSTDAA